MPKKFYKNAKRRNIFYSVVVVLQFILWFFVYFGGFFYAVFFCDGSDAGAGVEVR